MGTKLSLVLLTLSCVLMFSVPVMAQTSPSAGTAQYQYDPDEGVGPGDSVGDRAARDAITAWGAIRSASTDAQDADVASASETSDEATTGPEEESIDADADASGPEEESTDADANASGPEELPDTGGPSPLWFLFPLLCAGGLIARRIP